MILESTRPAMSGEITCHTEEIDIMATAQALLRKFTNVKTLPDVAIRLSNLISDQDSTIQEFEDLIRMDPTLVMRLLRLVNNPYYGLQAKSRQHWESCYCYGYK